MPKKSSKSGKIMSLSQMAEVIGVERATLRSWITQGCPTVAAPDNGGDGWELDSKDVIEWMVDREAEKRVAKLSSSTTVSGSEGEPMSIADAEKKKAIADAHRAEINALLAELQLLKETGKVAPIDILVAVFNEKTVRIKTRFEELPNSWALRNINDPADRKKHIASLEDEVDLHRLCSGQVLILGCPLFEGHG